MEMAAFELGVCSGGERFVSDQDLEKASAKVLETFDGKGWNCKFYTWPRCVGGFTNGIREIIAISKCLNSVSNYIIWATAITQKV